MTVNLEGLSLIFKEQSGKKKNTRVCLHTQKQQFNPLKMGVLSKLKYIHGHVNFEPV